MCVHREEERRGTLVVHLVACLESSQFQVHFYFYLQARYFPSSSFTEIRIGMREGVTEDEGWTGNETVYRPRALAALALVWESKFL